MRHSISLTLAVLCLAALPTQAQNVFNIVEGVYVNGFRAERHGDVIALDMTLDFSTLKVRHNKAVLFTPCVMNAPDSIHLTSIGVYGRQRHIYYLRRNGKALLSGEDEISYRKRSLPSTLAYHQEIPYRGWMNGSDIQLHRAVFGCCEEIRSYQTGRLGGYADFVPEFVFVTPQAEVKTRSLEGTAYIDFAVDKTTIDPNYHNNRTELAKISGTISSVKEDCDITIDNVWLKGFASPESPYSHNEALAKGRTEAIRLHVQSVHGLPDSKFTTEYEPENWDGLRRYVEQSDIEKKDGILAIIDTDMNPDKKEDKLKATYPAEYAALVRDCYPYLRRTDYRVSYTVRGYSDIEEIRTLIHSQPQKLSLNEMYLLAQTLEPGSEEFVEVFEVAVRMYPDDPIANLNAANVEMKHNELPAAERYLAKAGDSPEAEYARGVLDYLQDNIGTARQHLEAASQAGIEQADVLLEKIR